MREERGGRPNVSRRAVLLRLARRVTAEPIRKTYDPAVARLLPHDPKAARRIRRLLLIGPLLILGVFAIASAFLPDPFGLLLIGIVTTSLMPMVVYELVQLRKDREPVPGFRSVMRAGAIGFLVCFSSIVGAHLLAMLPLLLLLPFADEASQGESAVSITAFEMPVGLLLFVLPQLAVPLAVAAGAISALFHAFVATRYRRALHRISSNLDC